MRIILNDCKDGDLIDATCIARSFINSPGFSERPAGAAGAAVYAPSGSRVAFVAMKTKRGAVTVRAQYAE